MPHKFDAESPGLLLSEERVKEINPEHLLIKSGLKRGMVFADIGCGPGFFSMPAAGIVGDTGIVYAIDTQEEMLNKLKERRPPANVTIIRSEENHIPLDDCTVDFALLAFVLHEAENRSAFLREVRRVLRAGSPVLFLEWEKKIEEKGPPFHERVGKYEVKIFIENAGFIIEDIDALTPSHYSVMGRCNSKK